MNFNTSLLHNSFKGDAATGSTIVPVCQTSAFAHESAEKLEAVFNSKAFGYAYSRISNPTVDSFEKRMAVLKKALEQSLVHRAWLR